MRARLVFRTVHLWITFILGGLVISAAVSGTLLVFKDTIDAAMYPELLEVEPRGELAPLDDVLANVGAAYPEDAVGLVMTPKRPHETYEVWMQKAGESGIAGMNLVYVDPYSAEVLGERMAMRSPMLLLHYWHAELLFGGATGHALTALGGFALIVLSVTGLVLWWPGRRKLWRALTIKRGQPWYRILYDLHRAAGFYLLPLLVLIASTGIALVYHETTERVVNRVTSSPAEFEVPSVEPPAEEAERMHVAALVRVADRVMPGAVTTRLRYPRTAEAPFIVRKKFADEAHPNGKSYVVLDPYTAEVLAVRNAVEAPVGWRLIDLLYPLHKGELGGVWTKVLHLFAGIMVTVFAVTGLIMWWKRTRPRRGRPPNAAPRRDVVRVPPATMPTPSSRRVAATSGD